MAQLLLDLLLVRYLVLSFIIVVRFESNEPWVIFLACFFSIQDEAWEGQTCSLTLSAPKPCLCGTCNGRSLTRVGAEGDEIWIWIINLALQLVLTGNWKRNQCNECFAFFVFFHCRSCTGICPRPTPRSQCVVRAHYWNPLHRGDKQLLISRLYMPIRLSILESIFICHHICILIADERNWILNLLAPSEGKQSRRVY